MTRTCQATGEALLVPARNRRSKVGRITGETGKSAEDERVAAGSVVAMKRSNDRGAKGPCHLRDLQQKEGKDEMTKASIDLQDLRRRIYVKAKAEPSWRFWGLYVHVCKMETLRTAYEMAKQNDGAPGGDGVTFEAIEAQGVEALLEQLRNELTEHTYQPLPARKQEIPKDGGKVRVLSIPAIRDRVVQGALKLILEPVFEADFQPGSFGYRPKRTAHDAIKRVAEAIVQRKTRVLDIDLRAYFDNVRHDRLLEKVACDLRVAGDLHLSSRPQGSMMECPVKEPCPPKCCYPDVRRSNPTCEASGTTASIWKHRSGSGLAEDGRLNASERPWLRSVIQNRPKVLSGRSQNGTRVGSSSATIDDGGNETRRTIGRSRPIRISTLDNRVSPTRSAAVRRRYPDRKEGHGGGGRGTAEQAKAAV